MTRGPEPVHSPSTGEHTDKPTAAERDWRRELTDERFGGPVVREWKPNTARQEREAAELRLIVDNTPDAPLTVGYGSRSRYDAHHRYHLLTPRGKGWTSYCGRAADCIPDEQATAGAIDCARCMRSVQGERGAS